MSNKTTYRCIVTGGSGFIGSHLVSYLTKKGWQADVLDFNRPKSKARWIKADIRRDLGNILNGYDYVFHLAAVSDARLCSENVDLCLDINVKGTMNLLRAARRSEIRRFVLASSSWLAGMQIGQTVNEGSLADLSRIHTFYGLSKLAQENLCRSFRAELGGPDFTILRYGTTYGPRMWRGLVIRNFIESAESQKKISVYGNGKQKRNLIYIDDLCSAHELTVSDAAINRTFYLTGEFPVSINSVAEELIKHFPATIDYVAQNRREPDLPRISNKSAQKELGWKPKVELREGIRRCVKWWGALKASEKREGYWGYKLT